MDRLITYPYILKSMKTLILSLFFCTVCFASSAQSIDYDALEKEFKADTEPLEDLLREVALDDAFIEKTKIFRRITEEYGKLLRKYAGKLSETLDDKEKELLQEEVEDFLNEDIKYFEMVGVMKVDVSHPSADSTVFGVAVAGERLTDVRNKVTEMYEYLLSGKDKK